MTLDESIGRAAAAAMDATVDMTSYTFSPGEGAHSLFCADSGPHGSDGLCGCRLLRYLWGEGSRHKMLPL